MNPLKVIVFVDEANAVGAARQLDRRIDWHVMAEYLADPAEGRMLVEMVLYKGLPPNLPQFQGQRDKQLKYVYALRSQGFIVVTKDGMPQDPGSSSYCRTPSNSPPRASNNSPPGLMRLFYAF